jgi:flagellar basal-body rod modification protein FlgD
MQTNLDTNARSGTTDGSIASAAGGTAGISNLFTTLLVAQIKNQNPLEPTDASEFVGQLTQLSQMEALQKLTDQGTSSASMLSSLQVLAMGGQVGNQVTVQSDKVLLAGAPVPIGFTLGSNSTQNTLVLTARDGTEKRIELGTQGVGDVRYTLDPAALGLADGNYAMRLEAANKETPTLEITGTLASVQLSSAGGALLNVAGAGQVSPGLLTRFNGPAAAASSTSTH